MDPKSRFPRICSTLGTPYTQNILYTYSMLLISMCHRCKEHFVWKIYQALRTYPLENWIGHRPHLSDPWTLKLLKKNMIWLLWDLRSLNSDRFIDYFTTFATFLLHYHVHNLIWVCILFIIMSTFSNKRHCWPRTARNNYWNLVPPS